MRSYHIGLLSAVADLGMLAVSAPEALVIDASTRHRPGRRDPEPGDDTISERSAPEPKPERIATEADNTRLRQAAERRYRKAQRQALGMAPPAIGASSRSLQSHRLADPINTEGK